MSEKKHIPEDRFVIRPKVDPADPNAVDELAGDITGWVIAQRNRVRRQIAEE